MKPDERNPGGQVQMAQIGKNYFTKIINAKPTIDNKRPASHVGKKAPPKYKKMEEMGEVYEAFRKVADMKKGGIDHKAPETTKLNKMLAGRYKRGQNFIDQEHRLHHAAMVKRVQAVGTSMAERKKNQFDPVANPVVFFRRNDDVKQDIALGGFFNKVHQTKRVPVTFQQARPSSAYVAKSASASKFAGKSGSKSKQVQNEEDEEEDEDALEFEEEEVKKGDQGAAQKRPNTATEASRRKDIGFIEEVPRVEGNKPADYDNLKAQLVDVIIKYRLYKNDDLESLFGRALLYNKHLDRTKLLEICEEIKKDLGD